MNLSSGPSYDRLAIVHLQQNFSFCFSECLLWSGKINVCEKYLIILQSISNLLTITSTQFHCVDRINIQYTLFLNRLEKKKKVFKNIQILSLMFCMQQREVILDHGVFLDGCHSSMPLQQQETKATLLMVFNIFSLDYEESVFSTKCVGTVSIRQFPVWKCEGLVSLW